MTSKNRCQVKECPNKIGKTVCGLASMEGLEEEYEHCKDMMKGSKRVFKKRGKK